MNWDAVVKDLTDSAEQLTALSQTVIQQKQDPVPVIVTASMCAHIAKALQAGIEAQEGIKIEMN